MRGVTAKIAIPVGWAIVILVLCLLPKSDLPEQKLIDIPHLDKIVHGILFFVLFFALRFVTPTRWLTNVLICVAYGALVEILQEAIPTGRTAEWVDLLADAIGATFAAVLVLTVLRRRYI